MLLSNDDTPSNGEQNHASKIDYVTLTSLIRTRHSTRGFLPTQVPSSIIEECLDLAQHAPSNSNIQPWRITIATGEALSRVNASLVSAVQSGVPSTVTPIPLKFLPYRSAMGHALYGENGYNVPRSDKELFAKTQIRNFRFFDAPLAMILSIDSSLDAVDILSAGLYLQILALLLQERGVACCMSVSVAGYPEVLKRELGIEEHMSILCGVAVGYEDPKMNVNGLRQDRDSWRDAVRFVN